MDLCALFPYLNATLTPPHPHPATPRPGVRTPCTAASYDNTGQFIVLGTDCGSVQCFSTTSFHINTPHNAHYDAHKGNITSVNFSPDNTLFAARSMDSTISIYSFASFKKQGKNTPPIKLIKGIDTSYEFCNVTFSPDSTMLVAGSCVNPKRADPSYVHFYRTATDSVEPVASIASTPSVSTPVVEWAPKINQVIVGSSDGKVKVLYDPSLSTKGVLLSANRKARKVNALDALLMSRSEHVTNDMIQTPHALPLFQTKKEDKKSMAAKSKDRMPEQASGGIMTGRKGANTSVSMTQSIVDNLGISTGERSDIRLLSRDPREDLFKYNNKNPTGVKTGMNSYDTEKPVLAATTAEEEQQKRKRQKKSK